MMPIEVLARHIDPASPLFETVLAHSGAVARKALRCLHERGIRADEQLVYEGAMLHDIGVVMTDAPSIHCHGTLPYIAHGVAGREILEAEGLPRHALICERHTGSGLTVDDIDRQHLPLPRRDMTPQSLEERVICYADKFFSKSGELEKEKPLDRVIDQMKAHGPESLERFMALHREFGPVDSQTL